jgi:hypothetical protein
MLWILEVWEQYDPVQTPQSNSTSHSCSSSDSYSKSDSYSTTNTIAERRYDIHDLRDSGDPCLAPDARQRQPSLAMVRCLLFPALPCPSLLFSTLLNSTCRIQLCTPVIANPRSIFLYFSYNRLLTILSITSSLPYSI